jgi:hypothetical protein
MILHLVRASNLLQLPLIEDGDPIRQLQGFVLIVGDEDRGLSDALVDVAQLGA